MKRPRFTIRFLLILAALVAVVITTHQQRTPIHQAITTLQARGAKIELHPSYVPWFHRWTRNYFADPITVDMSKGNFASNEDAKSIAVLKTIERLYIPHATMNYRGVELIATLPRLKRLALWECGQIHGNSAELLSHCKSLEVVDVHGTYINGTELEAFLDLPKLQRLVFPARFTNSEDRWLNSSMIAALVDAIPSLVPVGKCYLYDVDDEDAQRFLDMDTSRVTDLLVRRGRFSDKTWRRIKELKLNELDLQHVSISDAQLALLDSSRIGTLDIYFGKDWPHDQVTSAGIFDYLREGITEIELYDNLVSFHDEARYGHRVRVSTDRDLITDRALQQWVDGGLREIKLSHIDHCRAKMEMLARLNPKLRLMLADESQHWGLIAQMTNLESLRLYPLESLEKPFQFTEQHRLTMLKIGGSIEISRDDLIEIAKLKQLSWLDLDNKNTLGDRDLQLLSGLQHLETIRLENGK